MSRRKFQSVVFACVLVMMVTWMMLSPRGTGEHQRLNRMLRTAKFGWYLWNVEKRLPGPVVRVFHIDDLRSRYSYRAQEEHEDLMRSGYLTTDLITLTELPPTVTNMRSCLAEARRRLRAGVRVDYCSLYRWETNQVLITCRSRDLALVRAAIQNR